jgi:hypothetical protein
MFRACFLLTIGTRKFSGLDAKCGDGTHVAEALPDFFEHVNSCHESFLQ